MKSSDRRDSASGYDLRLLVIANACQTVDETLFQYRQRAADPELLDRNNQFYLERYRAMLPTIGTERLEIVDAINVVRRWSGSDLLINEHNSCALNGIYLFGLLEHAGYRGRVDLVDNIDLEPERARALVQHADVVVFSTTFITSASTIARVATVLKSWKPGVKVVAGGAKLTQFADDQEIHEAAKACDALILSANGETALLELLRRWSRNEAFDGLPNLALFREGFVKTRKEADGVDINEHRTHWEEIPGEYLRRGINVRTGRGCPFKCKFCTFPSYNSQQTDLKSIETLIAELQGALTRPEVESVRFVDDTLFLSKQHLLDVCARLQAMGFDRPWTAYLRASTLNDECAKALAAAGCRLVLVGIESADQQVLNNMVKGTSERDNWVAAGNLARYGILGFAFILIGFPGETERSVKKTIDFLNNSGIHAYVHSPLFVFPKSPVSLEAQKFKLRGGFNDWAHDTMDCRAAIDACAQVFQEVGNAAYIDRGSSITKVLLDHGYAANEVRDLGIFHNQLARDQMAGASGAASLDQFSRLALRHMEACRVERLQEEVASPYSRTTTRLQLNAAARF